MDRQSHKRLFTWLRCSYKRHHIIEKGSVEPEHLHLLHAVFSFCHPHKGPKSFLKWWGPLGMYWQGDNWVQNMSFGRVVPRAEVVRNVKSLVASKWVKQNRRHSGWVLVPVGWWLDGLLCSRELQEGEVVPELFYFKGWRGNLRRKKLTKTASWSFTKSPLSINAIFQSLLDFHQKLVLSKQKILILYNFAKTLKIQSFFTVLPFFSLISFSSLIFFHVCHQFFVLLCLAVFLTPF